MIMRREGDWYIFLDKETEEEKLRVQIPENVTYLEMEKFIEHLKKLARNNEAGPN